MTITVSNTQPNKIHYAVKTPTRDLIVSVSITGQYTCNCGGFQIFGSCKHVESVKARRAAQGRRF